MNEWWWTDPETFIVLDNWYWYIWIPFSPIWFIWDVVTSPFAFAGKLFMTLPAIASIYIFWWLTVPYHILKVILMLLCIAPGVGLIP